MDNPGEIADLCRLCLVKDQVNIPIFEEQGDIRQIFLKISSCLPVTLSKDDKLPKKICDGCSNKLDLLYDFWNTSANAEKTLLSWLGQAGVKDADETITAVAQQIAKPAETLVKEESETIDYGQILDNVQDSQDYQEATKDETEAPPRKRARRTAAVKAQINITPDSDEEDDDDDLDIAEPIAKLEDESDESDGEDKDPSYSEDVPGTSADDQAGPSGVGKDAAEAPQAQTAGRRQQKIGNFQCHVCKKTFRSRPQIERHYRTLSSKVSSVQCSKTNRCDVCEARIEPPFTDHLCFHADQHKPEKLIINNNAVPPPPPPLNNANLPVASTTWDDDDDEQPDNDDDDDFDTCIYCDEKIPVALLDEHETRHRRLDKKDSNRKSYEQQEPRGGTSGRNAEGLCSYCGLIKPGGKLRRHEYVEHIRKYVRKVCDVCGIFTCPSYIKEHMRTHDAEKGFKCDDCGKAFFRRKALARHKLVHSDIAQYVCTVCGKSFKIKFNLRVHMRTHEDVKPFSCSVCEKTFTTKQWRDNHLKTHGIVLNNR